MSVTALKQKRRGNRAGTFGSTAIRRHSQHGLDYQIMPANVRLPQPVQLPHAGHSVPGSACTQTRPIQSRMPPGASAAHGSKPRSTAASRHSRSWLTHASPALSGSDTLSGAKLILGQAGGGSCCLMGGLVRTGPHWQPPEGSFFPIKGLLGNINTVFNLEETRQNATLPIHLT